jgi:hypothetical protein
MSLLEKASGGRKPKNAQSQPRTSLFSRAMAASHEEAEKPPAPPPSRPFTDLDTLSSLEARLAGLPGRFDSILCAWSIVSSSLPFAAIALFLPQDHFLRLAARSGFPSGDGDGIPVSIAPHSQRTGELLDKEAKALLAPALGVGLGMELRAAAMWSDVGLAGLWVFHDPSFETSPVELRSKVASLLAGAASTLPASFIAPASSEPASVLAENARRYRFAVAFRFDLAPSYSDREALRGLEPGAIRSAFVSACAAMLAQSGAALAFAEDGIACTLGGSTPIDAELALFQFTKTLKRSLPFLAGEAFPVGSAFGFDPSLDRAREELSRFLSA